MNHYTYKLFLPETGEYYIGSRSCKCDPKEDPYKGSMKSWKVDKTKLIKYIYRTFELREEANEWEQLAIETCINDPLNRNYHIPGIGFHVYGLKRNDGGSRKGVKLSEEIRKKMSNAKIGKKRKPFKRTKKSLSFKKLQLLTLSRLNIPNKTKYILDTNSGIFYYSIKEISELYNISNTYLSFKLSGIRNNDTGFKYV